MIPNRRSDGTVNSDLRSVSRGPGQKATDWMRRHGEPSAGSIVLVGGSSLLDFRLRVAQSHVRHDMQPSHWSHAALIDEGNLNEDVRLLEVSLAPSTGFGDVPPNNGVQVGRLSAYDDATKYPNIACLNFGCNDDTAKRVGEAVERLRMERQILDIPALVVEWLRFAWGVGDAGNPLLHERGIPSAAFLEGVFGLIDAELTPGLSSVSSCPEAIWQSVKWWRGFYESDLAEALRPPTGVYNIGDRLIPEHGGEATKEAHHAGDQPGAGGLG